MSEEKKTEEKNVEESAVEEKMKEEKKDEAVDAKNAKNDSCSSGCCDLTANKNIFVWIIIAVLVIGGIALYQMNKDEDMSERAVSEDIAQQVKDSTMALIEEQQLVPAEIEVKVGDVTEESGLYKVMLTVQDQEVTSYMTKDMTKFIPQLIDLKEIEEAEASEDAASAGLPADEAITQAAEIIGLDMEAFSACVAEGRFANKVNDSIEEGAAAGIAGTPHNVIIANGKQYALSGAVPMEMITSVLDTFLAGGVSEDVEEVTMPIALVTAADHMRGNVNARVAFVEYSDVDCPFCKRHHDVVEQLVEQYGANVNFVYRHFPIDQLHPDARAKSEASECAGEIGGDEAFWQYLDMMFQG